MCLDVPEYGFVCVCVCGFVLGRDYVYIKVFEDKSFCIRS